VAAPSDIEYRISEAMGVLMIPLLEDLLELLHANGVLPGLWHFP